MAAKAARKPAKKTSKKNGKKVGKDSRPAKKKTDVQESREERTRERKHEWARISRRESGSAVMPQKFRGGRVSVEQKSNNKKNVKKVGKAAEKVADSWSQLTTRGP